jgi:argininosuccinate lyase
MLTANGVGYNPDAMTTIIERELPAITKNASAITHEQIRQSLDAQNFVDVRRIPGGPAASALEPEILRARKQITADSSWLEAAIAHQQKAHASLRQQSDDLLSN